jgi:hypothetical protein
MRKAATMAAYQPRELHIGVDAEKIVVGPYPLRMRTGRARRRRLGSIVEVVPVPPSGRDRDARVRFASQLALVLLVLCTVLAALGLPWWAPAAGSVALLAFVAVQQARAARTGLLAVPRSDGCHVLYAAEERIAYQRAVVTARRIQRTWPALERMIDPAEADRSLARALDDLAGVMSRRQEIRRLRAELSAVDHVNLPADSPAVLALAAQRVRVDALWRTTGETANRVLAGLNATALAGENLIRERRIGQTAQAAEMAIVRITAADANRSADAGSDLAERTAAVIAAYRELATESELATEP